MNPWIHVVAWTLIHFVWQGALLAIVAAGVLRLCRHRSTRTRYAVACVALTAMLLSPAITAGVLSSAVSDVATAVVLPQPVSFPSIVSTASGNGVNDSIVSIRTDWTRVDALLPFVVFGWLGGVVVLLVRMAGGLWRVRRLQVRSLAAPASRWQIAGDRLASRLGLGRAVHVVASTRVDTPTAVGWLRPVVLLPIAALANLTPAQVDAILVHELTHIRRYDYLVNVLQIFAETLLFYHPGVWWVSGRIRAEREHCCDDVAVAMCGDAVVYATALAELETWRSRETPLAIAGTGGSLIDRVRRVLQVPIGHEPRSLGWAMTLGLTLVMAGGVGGIYLSSVGASRSTSALTASTAQAVLPSPGPFPWQVYTTDHFDIHYYAEPTRDLGDVARAAERAYQRVSSDLGHDLSFNIPLMLFNTRADFEQQTVVPAAVTATVGGFSDPESNSAVLPLEVPAEVTPMPGSDYVDRQIAHQVTHIFVFDIFPRTPTFPRLPMWVEEGLADYMPGVWRDPWDLRQLRETVVADNVPKMTMLEGTVDGRDDPPSYRLSYNLGHAAFEFIEMEYGQDGIRQFIFALRANLIDGGGDPYDAAFGMTPDEFDRAFERYLQERFTPR